VSAPTPRDLNEAVVTPPQGPTVIGGGFGDGETVGAGAEGASATFAGVGLGEAAGEATAVGVGLGKAAMSAVFRVWK